MGRKLCETDDWRESLEESIPVAIPGRSLKLSKAVRTEQAGATFRRWNRQVLETDSLVGVRGRKEGTEGKRKGGDNSRGCILVIGWMTVTLAEQKCPA